MLKTGLCLFKRILLPALLIATILGAGPLVGATGGASSPGFSHVIIIMFENRPINGTFGVVNQPGGPYPQYAPYITSLADNYGLAKAYYDVQQGGCGSITSYIGITSANVAGIDAACNSGLHCNSTNSGACTQTGKNIADRLEAAGLTWKSYHENMTRPCLNSGTTDHMYDPGHNPWLYYSDIFSNTTNPTRCADHVVPAAAGGNMDGALLNDLNSANPSNYIWLTPNDCDGMYIYCPNGINSGTSCTQTDPSIQATCVGEGDVFVKKLYPQIANTQAWKSGSTVLFLTWDEPTFASSTECPGYNPSVPSPSEPCQIPGIWIGPQVKPGHTSNTFYTHFSVLTTLEKLWGMAPLTNSDASATPMSEFFNTATPDFTISANPTSLTANTGATVISTIRVSPVNFFTSTVALTVSENSTNLSCNLSPTTVTSGSGSSTLSCTGSLAGSYLATVTGTSGTLSHSVDVTFAIQDFMIATSASSVSVSTNTLGKANITVTPVNGFTGTVTLAFTTNSSNLSCALSSTSITGGSGISTLSCSSSIKANYLASVNGTSGSLTHLVSIVYHVTPALDFTLSVDRPSVRVITGDQGSSTLTITPANGFTGTVTLNAATSSNQLTCSLSSNTITGGSGTSTLKCSSMINAVYTVNVTGTSGSLSHSVIVTYQVTPPPPSVSVPQYIVVIVLENQPISSVYGSGCSSIDCGYITQLANTYGLALGYSGVAHQSLPNYLTLTSGGNYTDNSSPCSISPNTFSCDAPPLTNQVGGAGMNIVDIVEQSGRTWRAYMEDYVGGCQLTDATGGRIDLTSGTTAYHSSHNPLVYYPDISGNSTRCTNIVDANGSGTGYFAGTNGSLPTALLSDLNGQNPPNLLWLSPNVCNDGHDSGTLECPIGDPVLEQNNYLQSLVPMILNSNTFKNKPSALFITWDEGAACPSPGQTFPTCTDPVATIWAGPTVRQGFQSSNTYSHYSFITTLESFWNLTPLLIPASINAPPMLDFFGPNLISMVVGLQGEIFWNSFSVGNWSSWRSLSGLSASSLSLCPSLAGRADVLVRGTNDVIYRTSFIRGVWSGSWDSPGGLTIDQPACVVAGGALQVVVRGTDNGTWYNSMSLATGVWSGWSHIPGGSTISSPSLTVDPAGTVHLVVRGTDDGVWCNSLSPSTSIWSGWMRVPNGLTLDSPAVTSDANNLHIVVRGMDNGTWYNSMSLSTGVWKGWFHITDGLTISAPSLTMDSTGTIHLLVRGTDNGVWYNSLPTASGTWSGWVHVPNGSTIDRPALTVGGSSLFIVVTGTNNGIWTNSRSLPSGLWSNWLALGAASSESPVIAVAF